MSHDGVGFSGIPVVSGEPKSLVKSTYAGLIDGHPQCGTELPNCEVDCIGVKFC